MRMYYKDASYSFTNESAALAIEWKTIDSCSVPDIK